MRPPTLYRRPLWRKKHAHGITAMGSNSLALFQRPPV